jgi:hypothetical protein
LITIDDWLIASADDDGAVKVFKLNSILSIFNKLKLVSIKDLGL